MRLDELIGVHRYKTRPLDHWLRDFRNLGGWDMAGRFGTVVGHPKWKFVFKFFPDDECYLDYVRWAIENPHPGAPVFNGPPRQISPFHQENSARVWVVKMEKLYPVVNWTVPDIERHIEGAEHLCHVIGDQKAEELYLSGHSGTPRYVETLSAYRNAWTKNPKLRDLCTYFWDHLIYAPTMCKLDLHPGNIMQRLDGGYVITDPFWYGEDQGYMKISQSEVHNPFR